MQTSFSEKFSDVITSEAQLREILGEPKANWQRTRQSRC